MRVEGVGFRGDGLDHLQSMSTVYGFNVYDLWFMVQGLGGVCTISSLKRVLLLSGIYHPFRGKDSTSKTPSTSKIDIYHV